MSQPKSAPYNVPAIGYSKIRGETLPMRSQSAKHGLKLVDDGVQTVFDILTYSAEKFTTANCYGYREIVETHEEIRKIKTKVNGVEEEVDKKWTYFQLSEYKYVSFEEHKRNATECGAGLRKLGMGVGDRLHMFAVTSRYWITMAHAATTQSIPIVTAYETLGRDGLQHSLIQTKAKAIFVDSALLPKLANVLKHTTDIKHIIYSNEKDIKPEEIENLRKEYLYLTIHSLDQLQQLGKEFHVDPVPPEPNDLCCIMYTSGSTGPPKGVLLKHRNIIAAIVGARSVLGNAIKPGDGLLAYLPLAHIIEFVFENLSLVSGSTLGYASPKTLTEISVRNCKGDLKEFKPTVMVGIPAVWESVKKGVIDQVNSSGFVVRGLFWAALSTKLTLTHWGLPGGGLIDSMVFSKVKDVAGGRLRFCMSGGGPIAQNTLRFISMALAPMISGYGLTETCGMGSLVDPSNWVDNAMGEIPASVEVKLVDVPDLDYSTDSKPYPQGEIWIRGGPVTEGYLDLDNETRESFENGWFKTGDIGEFEETGMLRIIDRKKNLVKTLNGEYIALEKLESIYRSCNVVANVCIYAAPDESKPMAIIVPVEKALKAIATEKGITYENLHELVQNKIVQRIVLRFLQDTGKAAGLVGIDIVDRVVIVAEEWTPESRLVTSAQKVNRREILKKYKEQIDNA